MATSRSVKIWSRVVGTTAVSVTAVAVLLATWSDLPNDVATRWNLHHEADGSLDKGVLLVIVVGLAIAAVGGPLVAAIHPSPGAPVSVFLGALFAGIDLSLVVIVVTANRNERRWEDATVSTTLLIALLVASVVLASLAARGVPATFPRRRLHPHLPLPADRVDLSASNQGLAGAAGVLVVAAIVAASVSAWLGAGVLVVAGVLALFAHVDVAVDRHGIDVRLSPWPFPHKRIPIEIIEAAVAVRSPARLAVGKRSALVIRRGPCLRCDLVGGRRVLLGIDEPEAAVSVLDEMVDLLAR